MSGMYMNAITTEQDTASVTSRTGLLYHAPTVESDNSSHSSLETSFSWEGSASELSSESDELEMPSRRIAPEDSHKTDSRTDSKSISPTENVVAEHTPSIAKTTTPFSITAEKFNELTMYIALSAGFASALKLATSPNATAQQSSYTINASHTPLILPELYRSLALCNLQIPGLPIHSRSKYFSIGPRGLRVAKCEFLNLAPGHDSDCFTLSCRHAADGKPLFVLEYAMPLVSVEDGTRKWVLAVQMDFTGVVSTLTGVVLERWVAEKEQRHHRQQVHEERGGDGEGLSKTMDKHEGDDVDWKAAEYTTATAQERKKHIDIHPTSHHPLLSHLRSIRNLHRTCFTLTPNNNNTFWQTSWTSPNLANKPEDIKAAFSYTEPVVLREFQKALGSDDPRPGKFRVRWGVQGSVKWVFVLPMFRGKMEGWVCFLVGEEEERGWMPFKHEQL